MGRAPTSGETVFRRSDFDCAFDILGDFRFDYFRAFRFHCGFRIVVFTLRFVFSVNLIVQPLAMASRIDSTGQGLAGFSNAGVIAGDGMKSPSSVFSMSFR